MSSSRSTLIVTSGVFMPPILLFTAQFERTLSNNSTPKRQNRKPKPFVEYLLFLY